VSRIAERFAGLRAQKRTGLVAYLAGGDPSAALTVPLLHELARVGVDVIELGVPFSDPMADGPVIQRAAERAIHNHVGLHQCLDMVREFRTKDARTPVVLMGYANPIERMGIESFVSAASQAGADGVIVVDYPPEECQEFSAALRKNGMDQIFLLSPTSTPQRIEQVVKSGAGFLYYVSLKGITGAGNLNVNDVAARLPAIRARSTLPLAVGFGVRDGESARALAHIADAVVVGSRLVEEIERAGASQALAAAGRLMGEIRGAIDAGNVART
jgi:tryptophan synthase alpha chain